MSAKNTDESAVLQTIYSEQESATAPQQSGRGSRSFFQSVQEYFGDPQVSERWLAGGVLICALVGVFFGIKYVQDQVSGRVALPEPSTPTLQATIGSEAEQDLLGLRQRDTDKDGLSDYDELNVYGTSPYLPDSDSDSINDYDEIAANSDPNCPRGKNCFTWQQLDEGEVPTQQGLPAGVQYQDLLLSGQVSAAQLRELLIEGGVNPELLSDLSDDELYSLYQETLGEQTAPQESSKTITIPGIAEALTPDELRELLVAQGVDSELLNQVSDDELIDLAQQSFTQP